MTIFVKKDQSKIVIKTEKLTSTSALIKWNSVQFSIKTLQPYYKLQYWLQSSPGQVITHDRLNHTELNVRNLKPNSDYFVQIIAIQPNSAHTSEPTLKHFKTLLIDLPAPANIQVIRYEAETDLTDRVDLKWDSPSGANDKRVASSLKGYRIYYKETVISDREVNGGENALQYDEEEANTNTNSEESDYNQENGGGGEETWKFIDYDLNSLAARNNENAGGGQSGRRFEYTLAGLKRNRDYAIKIVALDYSNNEGEESQVQYANRLAPSKF